MRILITGAGGQLGRELQDRLRGDQLFAFDRSGLDIGDEAAAHTLVNRIRPAWIINAAAFNDVDAAESQSRAAFAINGDAPAALARAANQVGARLLHVSSDYVFSGEKGSAYTEDDRPDPISVYGRSKLEGERRVLEVAASACVVRTAWLYGRHGKNFVTAIRAAARTGNPVRVVTDQVGSPTSTAQLAGAIQALIQSQGRGLFHVVNGGSASRFEFARAILGPTAPVVPITSAEAARPAARPKNSALVSLRWEPFGLPPLAPWPDALAEYLVTADAGWPADGLLLRGAGQPNGADRHGRGSGGGNPGTRSLRCSIRQGWSR